MTRPVQVTIRYPDEIEDDDAPLEITTFVEKGRSRTVEADDLASALKSIERRIACAFPERATPLTTLLASSPLDSSKFRTAVQNFSGKTLPPASNVERECEGEEWVGGTD